MDELQIVVFNLNDEVCGTDTSQVQEIVQYCSITKVPEMPNFVDGVINLRGKVVPVINLNRKFNLGETEITKRTKIIITQIEGMFIGFIVNDVLEITRLSKNDIEIPPKIIHKNANMYLKNVGKKDDKLISILDLSNILNDGELESVTNIK